MDSPQQSSGRNQNPEAWVEREPATQPSQPYNPYPPQSQQPPMPPAQTALPPHKKHKKSNPIKNILIGLGAFVVLFLVLIIAMLVANSLHPVKKAAPAPAKTATKPTVAPQLMAYQKGGDGSLVVKLSDKVIANVPLPSGKTGFSAVATSNHLIVAVATNAPNDQQPAGFTITENGKITALTASIADSVQSATSYTSSKGFLDQENNFLSINCQTTTCTLTSLNLTSGTTTPITSLGYTAPTTPAAGLAPTSIALLGIDQHDVAYLQNYSQNSTADPVGTLVSIDLTSGSTTKSLNMPQAATVPPAFSRDFSHALFTQSQDNATGNLIDWKSGKTTKVTGSIGNGPSYLWSPDSKRALFLNNPHAQTNTLGVISAQSSEQTVLKTFPVSPTIMVKILGWTDNTHIQYELLTTKTANNFTAASSEVHVLDVDSGEDKVIGVPDDLKLLPVGSQQLATSA